MTSARTIRIRGLDGLRAFSIALVLLAHLHRSRDFPYGHQARTFLDNFDLGNLGVRVFFVISGFLITTLLVSEVDRTGTLSLSRFYFRRTLRIFPPFYLYVLVIGVSAWLGAVGLRDGDLAHAVTYTVNYHPDRAWHLGHAWSLSVEEQFYLLWPAVFRGLGRQRAVRLLAIYLLAAPLWRLALAAAAPALSLGIGETFFTTADSIATGCLLALLRPQLLDSSTYRSWADSRWFHLAVPVLFAVNACSRFARLNWLVLMTLQNLLVAVAIERATRDAGWVARVLSWRPVVLLGLWSYSVYLWQQPFLDWHDQSSWWTAFPLNLLFAIVVAAASYYLVEQPALRLRERLEAVWFPQASVRPAR